MDEMTMNQLHKKVLEASALAEYIFQDLERTDVSDAGDALNRALCMGYVLNDMLTEAKHLLETLP